jgi:hypothetical protein
MQTPSSLRVVLTQVPRPEAPADDRPGVEKALREDTTKEAGATKTSHGGHGRICSNDSSGWPSATSIGRVESRLETKAAIEDEYKLEDEYD